MLSRDLEKAKEAYLKGDKSASKKAHDAKISAAKEKHQRTGGQYIKSVIYGGLDGIITTFAVVAGVAGASLSAGVVLILGFANLIGDGLSMAIGDYLSSKSENEYRKAERKREAWEVENYPEGERKEMLEIYMSKGISEPDAKQMVDIMSKHKKAWVDIMMVEELGIVEETESPVKNALATFMAFITLGLIPLIIYVLAIFIPVLHPVSFPIAGVLTAIALFGVGALKVLVTGKNWLVSGLEMLLVGGIAAGAAYLIGILLSGLA